MSEVKNIPRLRFPEFKEEWIQNSLGDICSFSKGKGISKSDIIDDGVYECIRYGELYTHYNEVIDKVISKTNFSDNPVFSKINDVIIPASGETALDIATASCVLKKDVLLGGDLNIIRTKVNGVFLSYYLNNKRKKEIARLSQGNSVVHVYPSQLKTLKILIPHTNEFDKIADFLTAVDKRIELLEKKKTLLETYKKGVMNKIFSQEIRFKDDNGKDFSDWKEKRLDEICKIKRGKNIPSVENGQYYLLGMGSVDVRGRLLSSKYCDAVDHFLNKNDLIMPERDIGNGLIIGRVGLINSDNKYVLGANLLRLRMYREVNPIYIHHFINSYHFRKKIKRLVNGSAQLMITSKDIIGIKFFLPSEYEQSKISTFLTSIDIQTELLESQIDKSQTWKKGLLQKMFV